MIKGFYWIVAFGTLVGVASTGEREAAPPPAPSMAEGPARETVLERRGNGHFYVTALVNGQPVEFIVDTGASDIALTVEDARRVGIPFSESAFTVVGEGASGPVRGQVVRIDRVSVDGKTVEHLQGAVLEGSTMSLLGQAYLSRISSVQMSGATMVLR